jgi:hypothetical protein
MSTGTEARPNELPRLAASEPVDSPPRLKRLARDLRECATRASWPDVAVKLIAAAESLEVQAVEFEAGYSRRA